MKQAGTEDGATGRAPLLLGCASALLAVVQQTHRRLECSHGPVGALVSKLSAVAAPISRMLHDPVVCLLTFADDRLLATESLAESLFPPARHLFDGMHHLAGAISEAFPATVDGAADVVQWVAARFPLVGGALEKGAALANWWLEVAAEWPAGEERVIGVDVARQGEAGDGEEGAGGPVPAGGDGCREAKACEEKREGESGGGAAVEGEESEGDVSWGQKSFVTANDEEEEEEEDDDDQEVEEEEEEGTILDLLEHGWHSIRAIRKKPKQ